MALKAKKPEIKENPRLKFMLSGKSGAGKTFFALDFPKPYYIDTEGGAELKHYKEKLIANGGVYFGKDEGSSDFNILIEEVKSLATEKHEYKTLVIDSFSKVYLNTMAIAEEELGNEFGRDRKEANRPTRQLMRWLEKVDMNVILICHAKDKWERKSGKREKQDLVYSGTTFDGYDKLEYDLDLWVELEDLGKGNRIYTVKKSRLPKFQCGEVGKLDFTKFAELYGTEAIHKDPTPVVLASEDELSRFWKLVEVLNRPPEEVEKWKDKLKIEKWEEASTEQINKVITAMEEKIKELNK